jgi:hypothetical protein
MDCSGSFSTDRRCLRDVRYRLDRHQIAELQERTKRAHFQTCEAEILCVADPRMALQALRGSAFQNFKLSRATVLKSYTGY